jgi:hypothetical protein
MSRRHKSNPSRDASCDSSNGANNSSGTNSTNSTIDAIREICNDCDSCDKRTITRVSRPIPAEWCCPPPNKRYFDPGLSYFTSVITPVAGLTPLYSGCTGSVEFRMRRKNKTVTLQWEPFTGSLAASGIAFLTVVQSICNTPPYPISIPIYIQYKGVGRITNITINPHSTSGNIFFYLNTDGSTSNTNTGDSFTVLGGAISWIVD